MLVNCVDARARLVACLQTALPEMRAQILLGRRSGWFISVAIMPVLTVSYRRGNQSRDYNIDSGTRFRNPAILLTVQVT